MIPLLEIKTIPIEIQVKTKNASLEFTRGTVEMEVSRSPQGGVDVKSRPIHVRLDTFQKSGGSAPAPVSTAGSAPVSSTSGSSAAPTVYEATEAYEDDGQLTLNARMGRSLDTMPEAQDDTATEWEDGSLKIRYGMDKLNFDWKIEKGEFKFTPGDIQFIVTQRPGIRVRYTGRPIYVPRSADPNYRPVNVHI